MSSPISGLYGITDPQLLADEWLLPVVEAALLGGLSILQYRHKTAHPHTRLKQALNLKCLCARHGVPLIINDTLALAKQVQADGVHVGKDDEAIANARSVLGTQAIVGRSCYSSTALAQQAIEDGANYVAFGRLFPSHTKPHAPHADLSVFSTHCPVPQVGIGGITLDNAPSVIDAGAQSIAVIHGLWHGLHDCANDTQRQQVVFDRAQAFATLCRESS